MYSAVVELLLRCARSASFLLVVLDDIQWCDQASAELLHYAARTSRDQPVLFALATRAGALVVGPIIAVVPAAIGRALGALAPSPEAASAPPSARSAA